MDWSKILATVLGALILALQGININQSATISTRETKIENLEEDVGRQNLELAKRIEANQEEFRKFWFELEKQIEQLEAKQAASPAPSPQ